MATTKNTARAAAPAKEEEPDEGEEQWSPEGKSLAQKMLWVRARVDRVPRNGYNDFHKYAYPTEPDLVDSIRPLLDAAGLLVTINCTGAPVDVERPTRKGTTVITTMPVEFTVINAEKPDEHVRCVVYGRGEDPLDKGPYKAYTGAVKYFFMKTFQIPTGDEPEHDTEPSRYADERPARSRRRAEPPEEAPEEAPEKPARRKAGKQLERTLDQARADILAAADALSDFVRDPDMGDERHVRVLETAQAVARDKNAEPAHIKEALERMQRLTRRYLQPEEPVPAERPEPGYDG